MKKDASKMKQSDTEKSVTDKKEQKNIKMDDEDISIHGDSKQSLGSNVSHVVNPKDTKIHMVQDGNFNIKSNMKAGYGIVFKEGRNYMDQGPSYFESIEPEDGTERTKLTLREYQIKYQKKEFMHRGKIKKLKHPAPNSLNDIRESDMDGAPSQGLDS